MGCREAKLAARGALVPQVRHQPQHAAHHLRECGGDLCPQHPGAALLEGPQSPGNLPGGATALCKARCAWCNRGRPLLSTSCGASLTCGLRTQKPLARPIAYRAGLRVGVVCPKCWDQTVE